MPGREVIRAAAFRLIGIALLSWCVAAPAHAADQFTIDSHPSSFGAIVTDPAGNGYVAWEHAGIGGAADVPMFCKMAPASRRCEHPITLALPNSGLGGEASALQLFPILGPGNTVWIVTSRYVLEDTLIWTSSDGGQSFGAPSEIPLITTCQPLPPATFLTATRTGATSTTWSPARRPEHHTTGSSISTT